MRNYDCAGDREGFEIEQQLQDEESNAALKNAAHSLHLPYINHDKVDLRELRIRNEELNNEVLTPKAESVLSKQKIKQLQREHSKLQKDNTRMREALGERNGRIESIIISEIGEHKPSTMSIQLNALVYSGSAKSPFKSGLITKDRLSSSTTKRQQKAGAN